MPLPPGFAATVGALHAVGEHVLATARYRAVGRIGLAAAPGGFATPAFDGRVVRVEGADLVVEEGTTVQRAPITTLRGAGQLVGVEPGMPDTVYRPATPLDLDAPLTIDPPGAAALAGWFAMGDDALARFAEELAGTQGEQPTGRTLWPEHFDLALSSAEVNYGVSPGDGTVSEPYAYVGPWSRPLPGEAGFWNQDFGASLGHDRVGTAEDLLAFFRAGWVASRAT